MSELICQITLLFFTLGVHCTPCAVVGFGWHCSQCKPPFPKFGNGLGTLPCLAFYAAHVCTILCVLIWLTIHLVLTTQRLCPYGLLLWAVPLLCCAFIYVVLSTAISCFNVYSGSYWKYTYFHMSILCWSRSTTGKIFKDVHVSRFSVSFWEIFCESVRFLLVKSQWNKRGQKRNRAAQKMNLFTTLVELWNYDS